ncbi:MAG: SoxY-related AACIE arm protein [Hyphomicrobiaceae bacterium]|nr:SoxY-related AACIE arm protein [Hyphomicrobiaceae bacterium]
MARSEHDTASEIEAAALSRRALLGGMAAGVVLAAVGTQAQATPERMAAVVKEITRGAPVREGRVKLELPPLAENGNSVLMTITVESPMSAADHVKSIYVVSPENPLPNVARFHLGPRAGRARVATNIRLAGSQTLTAIAEMSDGSFWSGQAATIVTLAACIEQPM